MKGKRASPEDRKYILENKDLKFCNQMAVELGLHQATVRRIIQREDRD